MFENNNHNPNFTFSLAPIKQLNFSIYDDIKYSLSGTVESPEFATLVKTYFMRVFALKLKQLVDEGGKNIPKIMSGSLSPEERKIAKQFEDP